MTRRNRPRHDHCSATIRPSGLQYDAQCARLGAGCDTTIVSWLRGGRPCVAKQCSQGLRYGTQRPATRATQCLRMTLVLGVSRYRLRHDRPQATIWPGIVPLHSRPGRSARGLCAQAGFRVCTWCNQPSFDSMHCSESLFTRF